MEEMRTVVRPGGLLVLAVPVGADRIFFNLHRQYGVRRIPRLIRNWTVQLVLSLPPGRLTYDSGRGLSAFHAIFLLRNIPPKDEYANLCRIPGWEAAVSGQTSDPSPELN
eukprot:NODE_4193_length_688_cov_7.489828_g3561_i0.p3 GENE.NODE_4193_length_688_cov_7.489828_g3561_i0~~NODE_4193_length_688_cov_7.489828_g3561_i0.p3  ORF type:complete len:110 (-),score=22.14 NODE_4193_length_688_cov_7.489828_g3561_i0:34-363(-)